LAVKRGDIVIVVAAGDLGKPRPAIVVQADELGEATTSVIVCPLSSTTDATGRLRPIIEPTPGNGLRVRSQIVTDKITALRRNRMREVVGRLDPDQVDQLNRALFVVLGFAR
jgi:mRNA interferase MazF